MCLFWPPFNFKAVCQSTCLIFPTNAADNVQRRIQSSDTPKFTTAKRKTSGKNNNSKMKTNVTDVFLFPVNFGVFDTRNRQVKLTKSIFASVVPTEIWRRNTIPTFTNCDWLMHAY